MRHPEKAKDIQFYLFGQAYTLKKTHKKTDAKTRNELFSVLPSYVVNQCIRNGLNYKDELTPSARRCVQFLTDKLNKLPIETKEDIAQNIKSGAVRQEVIIGGMFNHEILIDVLRNFTIYMNAGSKEIKVICGGNFKIYCCIFVDNELVLDSRK